ncbi:Tfp pilus assembly protein PilF [Sulfurisoma sediminicola]|uniref:Tfp pilus assembly protein PilF n=2 Tax=Sulfurisoma sediminicola TaxID=1381557 RepID=A0A497XB00_9PROT|nr:Tfp pilus assembly protein PilF [Sulfurisoma sediminicola]
MDALKKAEQAKQSGDPPAGAGEELRLEPIDAATPATAEAPAEPQSGGKQLPELPAQLEVLDADFIAHAASAPPEKRPSKPAAEAPQPQPRPAPQPAAAPQPVAAAPAAARPGPPPRTAAPADNERKAAQQVFTAKQPERSRKGFAIAVGGATVVGIAAIGGYFWWQLQPKSGLAGKAPTQASPAPQPSQIAAAPPAAPMAPAAAPALPAPAASTSAAAKVAARSDDEADEAPPPRRAGPTRAAPAAAPADPASPVRITRSQLKVNPSLAQGFEALNAGDLATAQAEYERVLRSEPRNSDALHGLAAIALRQHNVAKAEDYWLKALEADPKDARAQAALINSGARGGADPQAQESRLKTLIAAQPEIAALHFALGNILARQARWNESQQAYFRAYSIEPENPDYAFNLAVSLDQLRQPRLAAQYYNQALATAAQRPAGFDKALVASRLRELQP